MADQEQSGSGETKNASPLREITQPFIDLAHAPRALWGINFPYLLEGFCYFGILQYLAMYFVQYAGQDDIWSQRSKMVLTAGITIAMFLFGGRADKWGVRFALLAAFVLMIAGRSVLAFAPLAGGTGAASPMYVLAICGLLLVVLGYGMYQPAAYAGVRQFTTPATAGMGYAMLYALMNLGGWLPSFMTPIRDRYGIAGAYRFYAALTVVSLIMTWLILTRRTVQQARAAVAAAASTPPQPATPAQAEEPRKDFWDRIAHWLVNHPLADAKFAFFIFCLIPVQTLFAFNFGTYQAYVDRAYSVPAVLATAGIPVPATPAPAEEAKPGTAKRLKYADLPQQIREKLTLGQRWTIWAGEHFEAATSLNSLLIFILVPIITALTQKRKVYNMMITGTFVMAAPTFLLALGPSVFTLGAFVILMTLGEAMWQPRFLQYAAEIAPEGRTGAYMGVAQFPWFLTKMIVPVYEGWFLKKYCPLGGQLNTQTMWFIYGCIAMGTCILLLLAKGWVGKDFKTKAT
ncbi:MAG TPA: MFS transporter [Phycisphaerae bacterium]|nr:MFS transporter [Phycisphaerae bacterium]